MLKWMHIMYGAVFRNNVPLVFRILTPGLEYSFPSEFGTRILGRSNYSFANFMWGVIFRKSLPPRFVPISESLRNSSTTQPIPCIIKPAHSFRIKMSSSLLHFFLHSEQSCYGFDLISYR